MFMFHHLGTVLQMDSMPLPDPGSGGGGGSGGTNYYYNMHMQTRALPSNDNNNTDVPVVSDTPHAFVIFTFVYVACTFLFLIPVALYKRHKRLNAIRRIGNAAATATSDAAAAAATTGGGVATATTATTTATTAEENGHGNYSTTDAAQQMHDKGNGNDNDRSAADREMVPMESQLQRQRRSEPLHANEANANEDTSTQNHDHNNNHFSHGDPLKPCNTNNNNSHRENNHQMEHQQHVERRRRHHHHHNRSTFPPPNSTPYTTRSENAAYANTSHTANTTTPPRSSSSQVVGTGGGGGGGGVSPDFQPGSLRRPVPRANADEQGSAVPSALSSVTSTTLRQMVDTMVDTKMGSVFSPQKNKGAVRAQAVRRFVHAERQSAAMAHNNNTGGTEEASTTSRSRDPSWLMMAQQLHHPHRASYHPSTSQAHHASSRAGGRMSDAAGSILLDEIVEGESDFYRQRFVERSRRNSASGRSRIMRSTSITGSDFSIMPPLNPDVLSPEDAADANDPGRPSPFAQYNNGPRPPPHLSLHPHYPTIPFFTNSLGEPAGGGGARASGGGVPVGRSRGRGRGFFYLMSRCGGFLDCVEPDGEMRRIVRMAVPSMAGAIAERILRLVLIGIISYYVNTESMVAFVLVTIFLRLTMEAISGAIVDTEVINLQNAMAGGGDNAFYEAGQIIQLALTVQTLIGLPVLIGWAFGIGGLVGWLMSGIKQGQAVIELSIEYTQVIVVDYYIRIASKTLLAPFHMNGRAPFENIIDVIAAVATMITIGTVVATDKDINGRPTLVAVAWIQVIFSFGKTAVKLAYVNLKGWAQPYRIGFVGKITLLDPRSVYTFIITAIPMFIGSLIELREWDILILFVRSVGPGQVVTWAIMGAVWEMFEAGTDGLGGAGAMRISFYLAENQPTEARIISFKVVFLAAIQAFTFGSIFLMLGPNLSVWLTSEAVLENMFNQLVGLTALASFSMTFALIGWSLVGSGQGRFGLATICTAFSRWFVVYPIAGICVLEFHHDVTSVAASVAIGYATAGYALGCILICSDWKQLALEAHQEFFPPEEHNDVDGDEDPDEEGGEEDEEESSSDDDDSIIL